MPKVSLCLIVLFVTTIAIWLIGRTGAREEHGDLEKNQDKTQVVLYRQGKAEYYGEQSLNFKEVLSETEQLLNTADSGYRLIMTADRLEEIKRSQLVIEVIYPTIQSATLRNRRSIYFTKLLIPLTGQFSNGTIFFAGADAYTLQGKKPEYAQLLEYGSTNFVRNTQGLSKLKEALDKMGIKVN